MLFQLVQTTDRNINQLQNSIAQALRPVLTNPLVNGNIVTQTLVIGVNAINHGLGRVQQGWFLTDINGIAAIYRSASFSDTSLQLTSSAVVTVNIYCF